MHMLRPLFPVWIISVDCLDYQIVRDQMFLMVSIEMVEATQFLM